MGTLNRVFVPLLIMALPIAAMLAYLTYYTYEKGRLPAAPQLNEPAVFGGAQWPVFRSDSSLRGAAEGNLPDRLALVWRLETEGAITSTPVAAAGTVFVGSMDGHLYAADLATGHLRWRFEANNAIQAAPLIADGTVYVGAESGTLYAIDAEDGAEIWTFSATGKILGSANTFLDTQTGKRRIVVGSYDNYLYCLDARDGQLIWKHQAGNYIHGAPAIADGAAIFGSCDGILYIVPLDDPQQTRTVDIEAYMASSPAVDQGIIYAGNYEGLFQAARMSDGQVLWQFRQDRVPFVSSPAVTDAYVLFGARNDTLYCLHRQTGAPAWTFETTGRIDSSPVVCGDRVIVGSDNGRLYMLDLTDGREVFSYTAGQPISGSAAIVDNTVLIGCQGGVLYAFREATPLNKTQ